MENFNYFVFARALHVIGVVLWIGGMAFVTTVFIPSLRKITDSTNKLELFEKLEGKFAVQAKLATLVTGISGFYMLEAKYRTKIVKSKGILRIEGKNLANSCEGNRAHTGTLT
jgi:uncharacterized membrane protein